MSTQHWQENGDRVQIAFYTDSGLKEIIRQLALKDDRSMGNYIERIVRQHVERKTRKSQ